MMKLYLASQAGDDKFGTGQVYFDALPTRQAWGVHLSENPEAAEDRRRSMGPLIVTLGGNEWRQIGRHEFTDEVGLSPAQVLPEHLQRALWAIAEVEPTEGDDMEESVWYPMLRTLRAAYPSTIREGDVEGVTQNEHQGISQKDLDAIYSEIETGRLAFTRGKTLLYTVEADAWELALLDWDAKLSEQTVRVRECLRLNGLMDRLQEGINQEMITGNPKLSDLTGEEVYGVLTSMEPSPEGYAEGRTDQRTVSLRLLRADIPGLRMRDHYSRPQDGWKPGMPVTRDVILFDVEKVRITHCEGGAVTASQAREALENVQTTTGVVPDVSAYLLEPESGESEKPTNTL